MEKEKLSRIIKCPSCNKAVSWSGNIHRPFCSEDCQNKDLGNWATERYRIGSEEDDESKTSEE